MAGSSYGTIFRITTWGESHGEGVGVVIDGCPAGLPLSEEDIQDRVNSLPSAKKVIRRRSYPVSLKDALPELRSPFLYAIRIRNPATTVIS